MFEKDKPIYKTRAIHDELSLEHQQFILQYVYHNQEKLTDYLQIFEFYVENNQQWLIQRQEEPERETTIYVDMKEAEAINEKVWVIDQQDHVIILYPNDY